LRSRASPVRADPACRPGRRQSRWPARLPRTVPDRLAIRPAPGIAHRVRAHVGAADDRMAVGAHASDGARATANNLAEALALDGRRLGLPQFDVPDGPFGAACATTAALTAGTAEPRHVEMWRELRARGQRSAFPSDRPTRGSRTSALPTGASF